jgi:hypothetical protein
VVVGLARRAATTEAGRWLFGLAFGVYFFTAGGSLTTTDAVVAFDVTRNLVERGTLATSGNLLGAEAFRGIDGRYYSPFGILQSIYNIPFYMAGRIFVDVTGVTVGKPDSIPKAAVALGQSLIGAWIVWLIFNLSLKVTGDESAAALAALTAAFGTVLWPYAKFGFNQPLACATLAAAVDGVLTGIRQKRLSRTALGGLWLAASLLTRHEMAIAALPLGIWLLLAARDLRERIWQVLAFLPGVLAGVAAWMALNVLRFGNAAESGYLRDTTPGFGSPVFEGLAGLLVSPGTSLFLYSPAAVFGTLGLVQLWRRDRKTAILFSSIIVVFVLFYATLGNWMAGRSWGSRYLVVVVPYLMVGWAVLLSQLARGWRAIAMVMVTSIGIIVQLPGVMVDYAKVSQARAGELTLADRQWNWEASPLALNARAMATAVPDNFGYVTGLSPVPRIARPSSGDDRTFSQQFAFSLDFWWLYLFYLGLLPRAGVGIAIAALAVWVVLCARGLGRELA